MSRRAGPWLVVLLGLLAFCTVGFRPYLSTTGDAGGQRLSHEQGLALAASMAPPAVSAPAFVVYDVDAGRVLLGQAIDERRAPASTTKIATAMLALQKLPLDQTVTVGEEVTQVGPEDSVAGLVPGDAATIEQLLYATLLTSGNDAALALAVAAGGSVDAFVASMNDLVAGLGLANTHFVNPHGMDAADHYASAYDLARLAEAAMRHPVFEEAVATAETGIGGWTFVNKNELLGRYEGVDGVKTGTTDEAGQSLVASATRAGHRVIVVVLGSADRYADTTALLDYYYASYAWRELRLPENALDALPPAADGRPAYLRLDAPPAALLSRWETPWMRVGIWPAEAGAWAAQFRLGERVLAEAPLVVYTP